jgi:hypothetical protein
MGAMSYGLTEAAAYLATRHLPLSGLGQPGGPVERGPVAPEDRLSIRDGDEDRGSGRRLIVMRPGHAPHHRAPRLARGRKGAGR